MAAAITALLLAAGLLIAYAINRNLTSFGWWAGAFALLALLLAVIGLYGVLAFVVARRTREIGIRMALGAEPWGVAGLILSEVALIIGLGVLAGVLAGLAGGRYVESQLFGVKALDPVVFGIGVATVLAVSFAAGILPAWRAARIDPMHALRYE